MRKLVELRSLTTKGARLLFDAEVRRIESSNKEQAEKCAEKARRYASMRKKVAAWQPPTAQHEGLQWFMLEQIDLCKSDWTPYVEPVPADPTTWLHDQIVSAEESVGYHAKRYAEEVSRAAERKQWIELLYAGLPE